MSIFVLYDAQTGKIDRICTCSVQDVKPDNLEVLGVSKEIDDLMYYVDVQNKELVKKQELSFPAFSVEVDTPISITFPEKVILWIGIEQIVDEDGEVELEFETPGMYRVYPYLDHYFCPDPISVEVIDNG